MSKEPTKADLLAQIASMQQEQRERPEDALIRAIAAVVADTGASPNIKHMFYRRDNETLQVSIDMHGEAAL